MSLEQLDNQRIAPTAWDKTIRGYGAFCEHVAISADVAKALTGEPDFDAAAQKAWFAAGYLNALTDTDGAMRDVESRPPDDAEVAMLEPLLFWLRPIHRGARDGSEVTDTATLAHVFHAHAKASLMGLQFQRTTPVVNRDGVMLQPDPGKLRQIMPKEEVAARSEAARQGVLAIAVWLGRRHRGHGLTRVPFLRRRP